VSDRSLLVAAAAVVAMSLMAPPVPWLVVALVAAAAVLTRRASLVLLAVVLLVAGRAHGQLEALAAPLPGRVEGVAELVDDPDPQTFGLRVLLRVDGRRYVAEVPRTAPGWVRDLGTGDHLVVTGRTSPLRGAPEGWVRSRHLAGRLELQRVQRGPPAAPWFSAANSVRRTYAAGAASFGDDVRPLFLGMVIGDDRDLSDLRELRFRTAGLSHLTAVSGQNVAFLLAVAAPLLTRAPRRVRAVATVVLLVVMVLVTRADPSVLRAGAMAAMGVVAVTTGRTATGLRILALTVVALLVVDPLLVHALGFRLSVAATAGLVVLSGPIDARLPGPSWVRLPLAVTLAAQVATAPLLVALGAAPTPVTVVANLLAVPAAGLVMMLGVTLGAVAGLVVEPVAEVLQLPARVLVGWIDLVARGASAAPVAPATWWRTAGLLATLVLLLFGEQRWSRRPRPRRVCRAAVVGAVVALCWPAPLPDGSSQPAPAVQLVVGRCGGVVVHLDRGAGPSASLEALLYAGVRRVDVLVVADTAGARSAAAVLQEQWRVRRRIDVEEASRNGVRSASSQGGEHWWVGGVDIVVRGEVVRVEASEAECRLAP
jgi:competence protein ComEC